MLDIAYILGVLALFALVGLAGKAVERMGPTADIPAPRATAESEERP